MAKVILDENPRSRVHEELTNWQEAEFDGFVAKEETFEAFVEALKRHYAKYTLSSLKRKAESTHRPSLRWRVRLPQPSRFASALLARRRIGNLGGWQPVERWSCPCARG